MKSNVLKVMQASTGEKTVAGVADGLSGGFAGRASRPHR